MSPRLHVATVHWGSTKWIEPQLAALEENAPRPFSTYAGLGGLSRKQVAMVADRFDLALRLTYRSHAEKLNALAEIICLAADGPEDVILFIDGDALPIAPLGPLVERLGELPLIAVRREENAGDPQPHPCFCMTTVGTWQKIGGDWRKGPKWTTPAGRERTDVGARLMRSLEDAGLDWEPLLRSNRLELHPLLFGVYGDVVYHHGGGFRAIAGGQGWQEDEQTRRLMRRPLSRLLSRLPNRGRWRRLKRRLHPVERLRRERAGMLAEASDAVFEIVRDDHSAPRELVEPSAGGPLTALASSLGRA